MIDETNLESGVTDGGSCPADLIAGVEEPDEVVDGNNQTPGTEGPDEGGLDRASDAGPCPLALRQEIENGDSSDFEDFDVDDYDD